MKSAVLVIDVQQGLCEGEGAAFDCTRTIARINEVTRRARQANAPVIFVQHESTCGYLEQGSADWQLADGLDVQATDIRMRKSTPDAFLRTGLEELLRDNGIERLVLCGMHSEFCVDTTTRRALALGFPVVLVSDGHTSAGNAAISPAQVIAHENATLANISSFGPRAVPVASAEVEFDAWSPAVGDGDGGMTPMAASPVHAAQVRDATEADFADIVRLNTQWEHFLSPMDGPRLAMLHQMAAVHRVIVDAGRVCAFMLTMREGCAYASPNYQWFADRYERFLYVDRVVIAGDCQGRGLARMLYADLLAFARASGVDTVTCEVDADPPNEPSRRLHAALGFCKVGTLRVGVGHKQVAMQALRVDPAPMGRPLRPPDADDGDCRTALRPLTGAAQV